MPELPEVETTRKSLEPFLADKKVLAVSVRTEQLRHFIHKDDFIPVLGLQLKNIERRGKHLIVYTNNPEIALHIHLGMTGSLRICPPEEALRKHDYVIVNLGNNEELRYCDPRKFGLFAVINPQNPPKSIKNLGIEPLSDEFNGEYLYQLTRGKRGALKVFIMDQKYLVGVGNIYAAEALFMSKISPLRVAKDLTLPEAELLAQNIKKVLWAALAKGGSTIKDFVAPDGNQGYFAQDLQVYGRGGSACRRCNNILTEIILGGRSTVYCEKCQL